MTTWLQKLSTDPESVENKETTDAIRHATGAAMLAGLETVSIPIQTFDMLSRRYRVSFSTSYT